jgi:predicted nuclease of predicted toxin-antitoxin system
VTHRFYADENFPLQTVQVLRQLGHDVLTVKDSGHAGKAVTDLEILAFATSQQRAVLTPNRRDFIQLHQQNPLMAVLLPALSTRISKGWQIASTAPLIGRNRSPISCSASIDPRKYHDLARRPNLNTTPAAVRFLLTFL